MKRIVALAFTILIMLTLATAALASAPVDTMSVSETVGSGDEIVVNLTSFSDTIDWKHNFEAIKDFTSGSKKYRGAGYVESVEITKDNKLVLKLKGSRTLTEEKVLKGEVVVVNKENEEIFYTVEYDISMHNRVVYVSGVKNIQSDDIQTITPAHNTVFVCDEQDPGYAAFTVEQLTGYLNMEAGEKIYLEVAYDDEDVVEELSEYLGEESYQQNIVGTYTFVDSPKFSSPAQFSLIADYRDAYRLYTWDGYKLTTIEAAYDTVEGRLWWEDNAPTTIVISQTDLFVPVQSESTFDPSKNPHTGPANVAEGMAVPVTVVLLSGRAVCGKKKKS